MIELKNVSVGYGEKKIVENVSAKFPDGEFICILGRNGSGKTTLLKAMAGIQGCSGQILLDGRDIGQMTRIERAKEVAYMPQVRQIPSIDAETLISHGRFPHLGFSRIMSLKDRKTLLRAAETASVLDILDRRVPELSGGERQRVYLAMVIAQDAGTILLDEPATYMDISHQVEIMRILSRLRSEGKNIIMVAHDLPQAFTYATKIIILHDGEIAAEGPPEILCSSPVVGDVFGMAMEQSGSETELYSYHLVKKTMEAKYILRRG